jgi:hypothetical protein
MRLEGVCEFKNRMATSVIKTAFSVISHPNPLPRAPPPPPPVTGDVEYAEILKILFLCFMYDYEEVWRLSEMRIYFFVCLL